MLNLANQRKGDAWIVGGEHLEVLGPPVEVDDDFALPCKIIGSGERVRLFLYVEPA